MTSIRSQSDRYRNTRVRPCRRITAYPHTRIIRVRLRSGGRSIWVGPSPKPAGIDGGGSDADWSVVRGGFVRRLRDADDGGRTSTRLQVGGVGDGAGGIEREGVCRRSVVAGMGGGGGNETG